MDLLALGHRPHPSLLCMFCALYGTVLQCLPPSFPYTPMRVVECSHNNFGSFPVPSSLINCIDTTTTNASTTPYLGVCIAQFKGLALLVVCLYKLHVEEVIFAWQAWMHELQMEDHFSFLSEVAKRTILFECCVPIWRCLFPSFFIVTFISLVKVFNILHLPK